MKREERPEIPNEAIRGTVVNAFAHRNYRSTANVQVYIFSDRLEIVSPGGLPVGMTEADLGVKNVPSNPLLFNLLYRMNVVEHVGAGIHRIRKLCREHGVIEPVIEVSENWVTTTFLRSKTSAASQAGEVSEWDSPQVGTKSNSFANMKMNKQPEN